MVAFWDVGGFATPCTLCNGSDVWQAIKGRAGGAVLGFGGAYEATKKPKAARFGRAWAMRNGGGAAWRIGGAARFGMVCGLLFCLMNQRISADSENFSR